MLPAYRCLLIPDMGVCAFKGQAEHTPYSTCLFTWPSSTSEVTKFLVYNITRNLPSNVYQSGSYQCKTFLLLEFTVVMFYFNMWWMEKSGSEWMWCHIINNLSRLLTRTNRWVLPWPLLFTSSSGPISSVLFTKLWIIVWSQRALQCQQHSTCSTLTALIWKRKTKIMWNIYLRMSTNACWIWYG